MIWWYKNWFTSEHRRWLSFWESQSKKTVQLKRRSKGETWSWEIFFSAVRFSVWDLQRIIVVSFSSSYLTNYCAPRRIQKANHISFCFKKIISLVHMLKRCVCFPLKFMSAALSSVLLSAWSTFVSWNSFIMLLLLFSRQMVSFALWRHSTASFLFSY